MGYILKRAEIHENLWQHWKCADFMAYCILQKIKNKNPINNLYIRVLLKRLSRYFQSTSSPIQKKAIDQRKTPMVPFVGFLFGWNVVLTSATFFHYEERNKFIVAVIILMYRCRTFIEIMNSHIVMVINEISIDKKNRFFFFALPFTVYTYISFYE